jgi:hypothetical protein
MIYGQTIVSPFTIYFGLLTTTTQQYSSYLSVKVAPSDSLERHHFETNNYIFENLQSYVCLSMGYWNLEYTKTVGLAE